MAFMKHKITKKEINLQKSKLFATLAVTAKNAKEIMTHKVITCNSEEKIIDALNRMIKYKLRRLPVVEGKTIIGELTLHQLIRKYYDATEYHPIVEKE